MRYAITILAIICSLALGSSTARQVPIDVPYYSQVVEQPTYDIGIKAKADTLVVFSATWCAPCTVMRPNWPLLRAAGYRVVYIDVDDPHKYDGDFPGQTTEFVEEVIKQMKSRGIRSVPSYLFYCSTTGTWGDKQLTGIVGISELTDELWKQ